MNAIQPSPIERESVAEEATHKASREIEPTAGRSVAVPLKVHPSW
jgi:hypothetical protein